ncbi:uncharacterized protein K452DRAFT_311826 [Aplosporella prunicola CBS 121167]|uniref:Uncharacterized protein n=1 Tax=Aplosporella prunicola CBS 121167 TaxID=1176127 RepID=A0A6A6B457_9PEZI|nr:uncharacterized protein K452DRAFT_311826 [Aplosporella prunicola CBS 121167]KAF2138045.1 hypothetical protein K452DRAFT_311826 [Aplosporella prunicola CBS 121167]
MLDGGFAETLSGSCKLHHVKPDIFAEFTAWAYTRKLSPLWERDRTVHTNLDSYLIFLVNVYGFAEGHLVPQLRIDALTAIHNSMLRGASLWTLTNEVYHQCETEALLPTCPLFQYTKDLLVVKKSKNNPKEREQAAETVRMLPVHVLSDMLLIFKDLLRADYTKKQATIEDGYHRFQYEGKYPQECSENTRQLGKEQLSNPWLNTLPFDVWAMVKRYERESRPVSKRSLSVSEEEAIMALSRMRIDSSDVTGG